VEHIEDATEATLARNSGAKVGHVHAGKSDVDEVGELGLIGARRRVAQSEDVVSLGEGIDEHRNERAFEVVVVLCIYQNQTRIGYAIGLRTQNSIQIPILALPRENHGAYRRVPFST